MKPWIIVALLFIALLGNVYVVQKLNAEESDTDATAPDTTQTISGTLHHATNTWYLSRGGENLVLHTVPRNVFAEAKLEGKSLSVRGLRDEQDLYVSAYLQEGEWIPLKDAKHDGYSGAYVSDTHYRVNPSTCIGCQLCVTYCPAGAISMKNGKAVIDDAKCVRCDTCKGGDGGDFPGCPSNAIHPEYDTK